MQRPWGKIVFGLFKEWQGGLCSRAKTERGKCKVVQDEVTKIGKKVIR